ncbi:D-TA family PLP-dependent enzyme [Flavitalea flava]
MAISWQKTNPPGPDAKHTSVFESGMAPAWYRIDNADKLDSPALVIYPQRVKDNIRKLKEMIGGDLNRLRPHVKTHKSPEATRLMLEAGINKFKCATIAEGEMLAMEGAADVLLAYQPIGPKINRLAALIGKYPGTKFSCLFDDPEAAYAMGVIFSDHDLEVPVYLDLNVGMNRTGIEPGEAALRLYIKALQVKGLKPIGLHAYDGHIRDTDLEIRQQKCDAAFARVSALSDDIEKEIQKEIQTRLQNGLPAEGLDKPVLVVGGSPTFPLHARRLDVECSPGTYIYWDKGYSELCPDQPFEPAALVVTRVISLPGSGKLCLDLGHKSISAENELARRVFFLNAPELKMIGQSEEHLVAEAGPDHTYKVGDILYGLPVHICPTVALYERAFTVQDAKVDGEWKNLARDRKISI